MCLLWLQYTVKRRGRRIEMQVMILEHIFLRRRRSVSSVEDGDKSLLTTAALLLSLRSSVACVESLSP